MCVCVCIIFDIKAFQDSKHQTLFIILYENIPMG